MNTFGLALCSLPVGPRSPFTCGPAGDGRARLCLLDSERARENPERGSRAPRVPPQPGLACSRQTKEGLVWVSAVGLADIYTLSLRFIDVKGGWGERGNMNEPETPLVSEGCHSQESALQKGFFKEMWPLRSVKQCIHKHALCVCPGVCLSGCLPLPLSSSPTPTLTCSLSLTHANTDTNVHTHRQNLLFFVSCS